MKCVPLQCNPLIYFVIPSNAEELIFLLVMENIKVVLFLVHLYQVKTHGQVVKTDTTDSLFNGCGFLHLTNQNKQGLYWPIVLELDFKLHEVESADAILKHE